MANGPADCHNGLSRVVLNPLQDLKLADSMLPDALVKSIERNVQDGLTRAARAKGASEIAGKMAEALTPPIINRVVKYPFN